MSNDERERRIAQGRRLQVARRLAGMSQAALGEAVAENWIPTDGREVKRDHVGRIEAGKRDAEVGYVHAVAVVTGQPLAWLLGVDPDRHDVRAIPGKRNPATLTPVAPLHALPVAA